MAHWHSTLFRAAALVCVAASMALPAQAQERGHGGRGGHGAHASPGERGAHGAHHRGPRFAHPAPHPPHSARRPGHWYDGAHGHRHHYPVAGWRVRTPPPHTHWVGWRGARYGHHNGVWYSPYHSSYVVVRPPVGVVVHALPAFATVVAIGGVSYLYANGVYYQDRGDSSYEVVPSPMVAGADDAGVARTFVYPKLGQSAEKQASDEYECHRWAVDQTGFDPSATATGQQGGSASRADYSRALNACLEGRGYTVR